MKQSSKNINNIFGRITDAVIALDTDWSFTYANKKAEQFFCKTQDYLAGKNIWLEFPDEAGSLFCKACYDAMEKQQIISIENYHQLHNTWFQKNIYPSTDGLTILFRDITDKKKADLWDVTKRIEAEKKLQDEKDLSDKIINSLPGIFYMSDNTPGLLLWNKAFETISGYSAEELGAIVPITLFESKDHPGFITSMEKAYREGFADTEARLISKSGEVTPFYFTGVRIEYLGKPAMLGIGINITEKKKAEEEIRKSSERFYLTAMATNDMIWDWDFHTDELWWNYNYNSLFGYDQTSTVHTIGSWADSVHPDDRKRVWDGLHKSVNSGEKYWSDEYRYLKKDGTVLFIYDRGYVLHDESGKPYRMIGSMLNMTDRIKAQSEIIKEKNLSDSIINSLPGIFYLYNEQGKFLRWNKNFEFISKYIDTEISKMKPLDFFDTGEKELLMRKGEEAFSKGMADVEAHFFTKDKEKIPYYFTAWRIIFEGNPCLIGVGIDITEKVEAEELLIKSNEDIRRLASHLTQVREEERKRIGREIHDELGQQLTAMKMDVAWIDKKTPDETNPIKNKLKNIINLLDGSNQSVRRILTELSPGIIDNHGLLEALERLNRKFTATSNVPIELITAESKINLSQEIANCIFRVYQESLTNIMRYAKATKVITSLNIVNETIAVTIKDDGKGFDTAAVQNKKSFGILGMKERVLSQNGKFEIQSKPGKGTKIMITVPYRAGVKLKLSE